MRGCGGGVEESLGGPGGLSPGRAEGCLQHGPLQGISLRQTPGSQLGIFWGWAQECAFFNRLPRQAP